MGVWRWIAAQGGAWPGTSSQGQLYHRWSDLALLLLMGGWSVHTLHLINTHQV